MSTLQYTTSLESMIFLSDGISRHPASRSNTAQDPVGIGCIQCMNWLYHDYCWVLLHCVLSCCCHVMRERCKARGTIRSTLCFESKDHSTTFHLLPFFCWQTFKLDVMKSRQQDSAIVSNRRVQEGERDTGQVTRCLQQVKNPSQEELLKIKRSFREMSSACHLRLDQSSHCYVTTRR